MANFVRQLPGDVLLAALPQTDDGGRTKLHRIVRNNCTGCHNASYVLQHRFDEDGWRKVIATMKNINGAGVDQRAAKRAPNGVLDANENALAAYLARARGPGDSSMNFATIRARPSGEAARAVFREYDVPVDPEIGDDKILTGDGSDWSRGTPARRGSIVHDAWMDLDGNIWVNSNAPNRKLTIARVDGKTGAYKPFVVPGRGGFAGNSHGMWRDKDGVIWFNVNTGRGGLAKIDPRTEKIDVYMPPQGMSQTGGATTVDIDGKGQIWVTTDVGALRFDPVKERFTEFKSPTPKLANGTFGRTYGLAADRNGNGWWAQMQTDTIGMGDIATGQSREIRLAPVQAEMDRLTPDERAYYANMLQPDYNTPIPWQQGPRRMGTDKNADVLWVGNSWGGNLARIDTNTGAVSYVPMPDPNSQQPYQIAVEFHARGLDQHVDHRPRGALQPGDRTVDAVRPAVARHRGALHLDRRARRPDQRDPALCPHLQDRGDDAAQRGRHRGVAQAGAAIVVTRYAISGTTSQLLPAMPPHCGRYS